MTVKGVKLSKLQRKIYDACNLDTEDSIIVVSCGRQVIKAPITYNLRCNGTFTNLSSTANYNNTILCI